MNSIALIAAIIIQQSLFDQKRNKNIIVNVCCPDYIKTHMNLNKDTEWSEHGANITVYLVTVELNARSSRGELNDERKILIWKC